MNRIGNKVLRRFNGLVILNMAGLAMGLASVIFIAIWVSHELSYDRFFNNAARIYRVESLIDFSGDPVVWTITPAPAAKSILDDFPEVEHAVVLQKGYNRAVKAGDNLFTAENLYFTDHAYFDVFSAEVITGDRSRLLTGPDEIVISRSVANLLFGNSDPVGRSVLFSNTDILTVTGVIENSPTNTHLKIDYLVPFSLLEKEQDNLDSWGRIDFLTYLTLKEQTDPADFNKKLSGYWKTKFSGFSGTLFINPLTRIYLYRDPGIDTVKYPYSDKGPITRVILFSVIGIVILLIASINFINLSTSFSSLRSRETGIKKVNGATRINLVVQFFGESLLQTFLATIAAIMIVVIMLPLFVRISGLELDLAGLFSYKNILIYLVLAFLTGILSGIYPAIVLSSFSPSKVLKPMPEDILQGAGLRKILVIVQFGLAFIFVFCILVINKQISHMQSADLGFDRERVMVIYPSLSHKKIDAMAEQIEKLPGVKNVALGGNVPVNMGNFSTFNRWEGNTDGKSLMFFMMQVDDKYLDLLDIKIKEGRQFFKGTISDEAIINETAAKRMDLKEPLGKSVWWNNTRYTIVGVVKDFHFHKLSDEVKPVFIYKRTEWWMKMIFVKIEQGDHFQVVGNIVDLVKENSPGFPVNYIFLDQETDRYYETERRLRTLINAATVLAIVISCIGLFSLTTFTVRRRMKEIGVRKAYGATIPAMILMLQKDFGRLVLVSSVIALPAGYYIINQWLNSYANHIRLTPVYFLASVMIILTVAAFTLVFHTFKVSNLNPAETLRNE